jgi:uncharacterized sodium:solute symporter family permease YidK
MKKEAVGLALLIVLCVSLISWAAMRHIDCTNKGGAYIQGQCLKVEVIK